MDLLGTIFSWLAAQPACVEVCIGVFFCLAVGPIVLAGIAMGITAAEGAIEQRLNARVRTSWWTNRFCMAVPRAFAPGRR
jgi:hypothetical protein